MTLAEWRARRADLVGVCAARWSLTLGPPYAGPHVSFAAPARTATGERVVLKLQFPHREVEHEAEALRRWGGVGAVRLLDADPEHHALLLERAEPGTPLSATGAAALDVLVGLLPRLWVPAGPPFVTLRSEAARWCEHLGDPDRTAHLDAGLVARTVGILGELGPSVTEAVVLHQDLHGDNVVRAQREPWLVIDPKPLSGEREFSVAPIVRSAELGHTRAEVRHRLDRLTAELGLDRERARGWAVGQTIAWAGGEDPALTARHEQVARWLLER
jgi:streptomycin 6-kinase